MENDKSQTEIMERRGSRKRVDRHEARKRSAETKRSVARNVAVETPPTGRSREARKRWEAGKAVQDLEIKLKKSEAGKAAAVQDLEIKLNKMETEMNEYRKKTRKLVENSMKEKIFVTHEMS